VSIDHDGVRYAKALNIDSGPPAVHIAILHEVEMFERIERMCNPKRAWLRVVSDNSDVTCRKCLAVTAPLSLEWKHNP
jgi:hypothetical protein